MYFIEVGVETGEMSGGFFLCRSYGGSGVLVSLAEGCRLLGWILHLLAHRDMGNSGGLEGSAGEVELILPFSAWFSC